MSSLLWMAMGSLVWGPFESIACGQTAVYNEAYTIQGFSQPNRTSQVAAPSAGIVQSLVVAEGDRVQQGDILVQLDRSVHNGKLELARVAKESMGDLRYSEAELAAKRTRLQRLQELASRNHATPIELLQAQEEVALAETALIRAQDRLAQQEAEYQRLLAESAQFSIPAPFDGTIIEFMKQPGEYVGPGDAVVCTIAELETLSIEFLLPRSYREQFQVGDKVEVLFTVSGRNVPGIVRFISPFPNPETNTFVVKTQVDNTDNSLSAGERCQLKLKSVEPSEEAVSDEQRLSMRGS